MRIAVLPGDGVGPEVTAEAVKVLRAACGNHVPIEMTEALIGAAAVEKVGVPLPLDTLELARNSDAILFGSVGGPLDELADRSKRPGSALLKVRKELGLFANFRPAYLFDELAGASTLKPEIVKGLDILILRELNGDIYFGEPRGIQTDAMESVSASTPCDIRKPRSGESHMSDSRPLADVGASSPPSTRPTCSRPCIFGARW